MPSPSCCKPESPRRAVRVDYSEVQEDKELNVTPRLRVEGEVSIASSNADLLAVFTDCQHRQEHLLNQVLDQQKQLKHQVSVMHLEFREFREVQEFYSKPLEMAEKIKRVSVNSGTVSDAGSENLMQSASATEKGRDENPGEHPLPVSPSRSSASRGSRRSANLVFGREYTADFTNDSNMNGRFDKLLQRKEFELIIAVAILTNALIMCWECQYHGLDVGFNLQYPGRQAEAHNVWAGAQTLFDIFDWSFGLLFLLELILKLLCWRLRYFYDWQVLDERKEELAGKFACWRCLMGLQGWNILDFLCVAAFLFDKGAKAGSEVNPQMIRLLRLFRLARLVRLLRFLETLDHLYIMTTAISGLGRVLTWAVILLTIMLVTCDLFIVQILQATYFDKVTATDLQEEQLRKHHQMYAYFGTFTRCMLSMFEITLGNWPPVARLLQEEVSEWFTLFCLVHKLTIGFAVIGVITGVILQETFKVAQTDDIIMFRQKKRSGSILRNKMQNLFDALDDSGDGKIEAHEFAQLGQYPEIKTWLASLDIETDDLNTLFSLIDVDGDGYITLDELVARMPRIKGNARSIDMLAMRRKLRV